MPQLGGPEAFAQIGRIRPNLLVIFASGHAAETAFSEFQHSGLGFISAKTVCTTSSREIGTRSD
jgi:hypothetical protein